jgi:hypothetical protein
MKTTTILLTVAALVVANGVIVHAPAEETPSVIGEIDNDPSAGANSPSDDGDRLRDEPFFKPSMADIGRGRYARAPVFGPLEPDNPDRGADPPSDDEVLLALEVVKPLEGDRPFCRVRRTNVRIVNDLITDYIDPPRVVPLIGPAQLHHVHYKTTIYFDEETKIVWPIDHTMRKKGLSEVIYMDKNHFHEAPTVGKKARINAIESIK